MNLYINIKSKFRSLTDSVYYTCTFIVLYVCEGEHGKEEPVDRQQIWDGISTPGEKRLDSAFYPEDLGYVVSSIRKSIRSHLVAYEIASHCHW